MSDRAKKIIIIGAGPAGLTAALEIVKSKSYSQQNMTLTVLESSETVGGLAKNVPWNGHILDIGGHRYFTKMPKIADWWETRSRKNGNFLETRQRKVKILFENSLYDYPVEFSMDTLKKLGLGRSLGIGCSYLSARCFPKKEDSLENFYINRFGQQLYDLFFKEYTEKLCGESLEDISPDWGRQRVRGLSLSGILKGKFDKKKTENESVCTDSDHFRYPKNGPGAMWEAAALEITEMGGAIRFGCRVETVLLNGRQTAGVRLENGEQLEADEIISTMPLPKLIRAISFFKTDTAEENQLQEMKQIAAGLKYRSVVCVAIETEPGACTDILDNTWIYIQNPGLKLGRVQIYNNWFGIQEGPVLLGMEFFCGENDASWKQSDEDWIKLAQHDGFHAGIFREKSGSIKNAQVIRARDAYPSYSGAYSQKEQVLQFIDGIHGLQTAGRNGTHTYCNMDRVMENAMKCADNIIK